LSTENLNCGEDPDHKIHASIVVIVTAKIDEKDIIVLREKEIMII